jgi:DNA adenine methylase
MSSLRARGQRHFTPLRYPGGKSKLAPFVKALLRCNDLEDGHYVEPFAGGAGIALEILLQGYVSRISLNDISLPIYAFWQSVVMDSGRFAAQIEDVDLNVSEWDRQKGIFKKQDTRDLFSLGFAAFYLNRTNRSGVLNGGMIGGRAQSGNWQMDARFNRSDLAYRVRKIGKFSDRIAISCEDAVSFLQKGSKEWPENTLIYADPPYFEKGRQLYYDFYRESDHAKLGEIFRGSMNDRKWIVSYDDIPEVCAIYEGHTTRSYNVPYSVRYVGLGSEVMFYSPSLVLPTDFNRGTEIGPGDRFAPPSERAIQ